MILKLFISYLKNMLIVVIGMTVAMGIIGTPSHLAFAQELKAAPVIEVSQEDALLASLKTLVGKSVSVTFGESESLTGLLEAVGPDSVKIAQLSGKEFYSAVVALDAITSVTYRAK